MKLYGAREPKYEPGSRWEYSNYGFLLLGLIVEKASGQDYYAYVREHILQTRRHELHRFAPRRSNRSRSLRRLHKNRRRRNVETQHRHASLSAAPPLAAATPPSAISSRSRRPCKITNCSTRQHTDLLTTGHTQIVEGEKYAYGFMDKTEGGVRSFGHGGGAPGMNGELRIYPASGYVIVVLANLDPPAAIARRRLRRQPPPAITPPQ